MMGSLRRVALRSGPLNALTMPWECCGPTTIWGDNPLAGRAKCRSVSSNRKCATKVERKASRKRQRAARRAGR